jgi:hypothetical protein
MKYLTRDSPRISPYICSLGLSTKPSIEDRPSEVTEVQKISFKITPLEWTFNLITKILI